MTITIKKINAYNAMIFRNGVFFGVAVKATARGLWSIGGKEINALRRTSFSTLTAAKKYLSASI